MEWFCDWQDEGSFCFQVESFEIMNPTTQECNDLIDELSSLMSELTKHRDYLKEL